MGAELTERAAPVLGILANWRSLNSYYLFGKICTVAHRFVPIQTQACVQMTPLDIQDPLRRSRLAGLNARIQWPVSPLHEPPACPEKAPPLAEMP